MLHGVIFDADGTLLDSTGMWFDAAARFLATIGIKAEETLGKTLFAMSLSDGAQYVKERYGLTMERQDIMDGVNGTIARFYQKSVRLKPGAEQFLKEFQGRNIPMALATATDRDLILPGLARTGILPYFQEIFTCGEVGHGKEQPDIYLAAQKRLGTGPEATWVFEDAVHGAKTANRAGLRVVGVYDPISHDEQDCLRSLSHIYLKDFSDFAAFYAKAEAR